MNSDDLTKPPKHRHCMFVSIYQFSLAPGREEKSIRVSQYTISPTVRISSTRTHHEADTVYEPIRIPSKD